MTFCVSLNNGDAPSMFLAPSKLYMLTSFCVTHRHLKRRQQRRQHKNFEGSKCLILGEKHFCLGYRLSKHKITIYSKNFGGSIAPLAIPGNHPWQRLWTQMSSCVAQCVYPLQNARNLSWPEQPWVATQAGSAGAKACSLCVQTVHCKCVKWNATFIETLGRTNMLLRSKGLNRTEDRAQDLRKTWAVETTPRVVSISLCAWMLWPSASDTGVRKPWAFRCIFLLLQGCDDVRWWYAQPVTPGS